MTITENLLSCELVALSYSQTRSFSAGFHGIRLPASARHKKTVAMLDSKTTIKVGRGGRDVTFILKIRCSAVILKWYFLTSVDMNVSLPCD